jgi:hypothetical protein
MTKGVSGTPDAPSGCSTCTDQGGMGGSKKSDRSELFSPWNTAHRSLVVSMTTPWRCHRFESWLVYGDPSLGLPATLVEEIGLKIVFSRFFSPWNRARSWSCPVFRVASLEDNESLDSPCSEPQSVALLLPASYW